MFPLLLKSILYYIYFNIHISTLTGWIDDGVFMQKDGSGGRGRNLVWNNFGGNTPHHAFTTGRPHPQRSGGGGGLGADSSSSGMGGFANKVRPKGPSQTLKLINVSCSMSACVLTDC